MIGRLDQLPERSEERLWIGRSAGSEHGGAEESEEGAHDGSLCPNPAFAKHAYFLAFPKPCPTHQPEASPYFAATFPPAPGR